MSRINCIPKLAVSKLAVSGLAVSEVTAKEKPPKKAEFPVANRSLHRLRKVRLREGVGLRAVSRHLGTTVADVKGQELETTDLPLSVLYKWQEALQVPVAELLGEPSDDLSPPLLLRARLVRVMKSAMTLLERSEEESVQLMSRVLVNQLLEIMPELHDISPWQLVGKRRGKDEYGQAVERCISDDMFVERTA